MDRHCIAEGLTLTFSMSSNRNGVYPDHILGEVLQACKSTVIIYANIVMAACTLYVLLCRLTDSSLPCQSGLYHQQSLLGAAP